MSPLEDYAERRGSTENQPEFNGKTPKIPLNLSSLTTFLRLRAWANEPARNLQNCPRFPRTVTSALLKRPRY
jgi:hypothetical protein